MEEKEWVIFYSWQSDLPKETNSSAIRAALRSAANKVEFNLDSVKISLDEATRNKTGSPNIPATIFDKILNSDIFVCDVSTINSLAKPEFRRTPNPNVLVELGYAVACLGWDRIIMLFNNNYGQFPNDLPFDIDRHRMTQFSIKDKTDKSGSGQLTATLKDAIGMIIEQAPLKQSEKQVETPSQKKRRIDITSLNRVLAYVNIPFFEKFIEELPYLIDMDIFDAKRNFIGTLESSTFHIYDQDLMNLLQKFKDNWQKSLSFGEYYFAHGRTGYSKFDIRADVFPSSSHRETFYKISEIREELYEDFKKLYKFIRNNYLEIDIDSLSKNAIAKNK